MQGSIPNRQNISEHDQLWSTACVGAQSNQASGSASNTAMFVVLRMDGGCAPVDKWCTFRSIDDCRKERISCGEYVHAVMKALVAVQEHQWASIEVSMVKVIILVRGDAGSVPGNVNNGNT